MMAHRECETRREEDLLNETKEMREEPTEVGLPTVTLAGAGPKPEVRVAAAPRSSVVGASSAGTATAPAVDVQAAAPFAADGVEDFRPKWYAIQVSLVDEPRQAVEQVENLVTETMERLTEMFAVGRERLEGQWDHGDKVSTENLRLALRRYRSFFGHLLSV